MQTLWIKDNPIVFQIDLKRSHIVLEFPDISYILWSLTIKRLINSLHYLEWQMRKLKVKVIGLYGLKV